MVWGAFVVSLAQLLAGPWPDPDWLFGRDHSADWWMVGTTFLLLVAATGAWRSAQAQLRSSQRPLVVLSRVQLVRNAGSLVFLVRIENVGPGPALMVKVSAWPRVPSVLGVPTDARRVDIEQIKLRADVGTPPYVVSQGAIGPGRNQDAFLKAVRDTDDEGEVNETFFSRGGVLLYTISY